MAFHSMIKSFRKYTKVWMAGLILVSMFTFVLCTGLQRGDFGSWLLSLLSGGGSRGVPVSRINGKDITDGDIKALQFQRKAANEFMKMAEDKSRSNRLTLVLGQMEPRTRENLTRLIMERLNTLVPQYRRILQTSPGFISQLPPDVRGLMMVYDSIKEAFDQNKLPLEDLLRNATAYFPGILHNAITDMKRILGQMGGRLSQGNLLTELQSILNDFRKTPGSTYFDGTEDDEGLFEFILWKNEADRLDIHLVDATVRQEVALATSNGLNSEDWQKLTDELARRLTSANQSPITEDYVVKALRDEFRVRLARTWHLGYQPGPGASPLVGLTPSQCWQFYQDNFGQFDIRFLPIPVQNFQGQIPKPKDEKELADFFDLYKDQLKEEDSPAPGFKEPAKVKVQWLLGSAEAPPYRDLMPHKSLENAVLGLGIQQAWNQDLQSEYEKVKSSAKMPSLGEPLSLTPFHFMKGWKHPANAAALFGQGLVPDSALKVSVLNAVYEATGLARLAQPEVNKRAGVASTLVLAGLPPCPGLRLGAVWAQAQDSKTSTSLPFEEVRPKLEEDRDREIARMRFQADWEKLLTNLQEFKPEEKQEDIDILKKGVMERITQAAKEHGFVFGPNPRDFKETTLWLTAAEVKGAKNKAMEELKKESGISALDRVFFDKEGVYIPRATDARTGKGFMFWKTDVQNEKAPASYQEIRDKVLQEWKLAQARKLAKARAEEIALKLAKRGPNDDKGRAALLAQFEKDLQQGQVNAIQGSLGSALLGQVEKELPRLLPADRKLIDLKGVARMIEKKQALARPDGWTPETYVLPTDLFPKPQGDWEEKLVSMGKANQKKVEVLVNEPESVWYVAARVAPPEASESQFAKAYKAERFWNDCQQFFANQFRSQVVTQLKDQQGFKDLRKDKKERSE